jgi:hypothetical protein
MRAFAVMDGDVVVVIVVVEGMVDGLGGWCGRVEVAVAIFVTDREVVDLLKKFWVRRAFGGTRMDRRCFPGMGIVLVLGGCRFPCHV